MRGLSTFALMLTLLGYGLSLHWLLRAAEFQFNPMLSTPATFSAQIMDTLLLNGSTISNALLFMNRTQHENAIWNFTLYRGDALPPEVLKGRQGPTRPLEFVYLRNEPWSSPYGQLIALDTDPAYYLRIDTVLDHQSHLWPFVGYGAVTILWSTLVAVGVSYVVSKKS